MLQDRLGVVMINVSDMDRAVAFYRDVLGLELRFQSSGWSELVCSGVTLALHGVGSAPSEPAGARPRAGTVSIGWNVDDLDRSCEKLRERGVAFLVEPTDQPEEGIRLAVFADPDGCAHTLAQHLPPS